MARLTNKAGTNDNGGTTWAERRRRDSYGTPDDSTDDADDNETSDE